MSSYLDFEKPIAEIEGKIRELRHLSDSGGLNIVEEVARLQGKVDRTLRQTYARLSPWQKTLVARHALRPHCLDYVQALIEDFTPLAGDRKFGEDRAVIGGLGRFRGHSIMLIGQEKGADTESRIKHNFGMPNPEGYRKAVRLMRLAERFNLPVVTLVDTAGAYPGVGAEERGQAEAIARSIETCVDLRVPIVSVIIGEGGSGGAIALATANRILMLEHAIYSVISPEGCASILWRSAEHAQEAAEALKLTAEDLLKLGVIDEIIPEPLGGAHRKPEDAINAVGEALERALDTFRGVPGGEVRSRRRQKFLAIGQKGLG
ncbi:MAG: acetyl-CoA carboxylase carboxyltransferase subunit alpha [Alphaproteobacteria bacterium]|nr:acetyl-CoA carboxylase carboxyltransferase subunit alpha [Alphaproteobacteria bacterium]